VTDLLEHLRHLMLVQHKGEVPDSMPITEETRDRLREQANQLGRPTVIRLIDLLHAAVEDTRQGGDPRLPLELALVKATRPGSDLSRESLAHRLELLEAGQTGRAGLASRSQVVAEPEAARGDDRSQSGPPPASSGALGIEQLQEAWQRTILPAVGQRSMPLSAVLKEARPAGLAEDTLTVEFPETASFHRGIAEEPKNATALREALYEVTGRRLGIAFATGEAVGEQAESQEPVGEEELFELMKETFDAREVGGE
jgi:DNA polymerase-3 subunit gamma/tau